MKRSSTIRQRLLQLLADGKPRRSDEIAKTLSESGVSRDSVVNELSFFANLCFIERRRVGKFWEYRRTDVSNAA